MLSSGFTIFFFGFHLCLTCPKIGCSLPSRRSRKPSRSRLASKPTRSSTPGSWPRATPPSTSSTGSSSKPRCASSSSARERLGTLISRQEMLLSLSSTRAPWSTAGAWLSGYRRLTGFTRSSWGWTGRTSSVPYRWLTTWSVAGAAGRGWFVVRCTVIKSSTSIWVSPAKRGLLDRWPNIALSQALSWWAIQSTAQVLLLWWRLDNQWTVCPGKLII